MLPPSFVSHMKGRIRRWHGKDLSNFLLKWRQCQDTHDKRNFCTNQVGWLNWGHVSSSWTGHIDPLLGVETYRLLPERVFMEGGSYLILWEDFMAQMQKLDTPLTKKDLEKFL